MSCVTGFIQCYVLKPESLALCLFTVALYLFSQSLHVWYKSVIHRFHYSSSLTEGLGLFSMPSGKHDFRSWERKEENVSIYALQGRRPQMEDRFGLIIDETHDVALYGIFDGHGGEFAAKYAEHNIFNNLFQKVQDILKTGEMTGAGEDQFREDLLHHSSKTDALIQLLTEEILALDEELITEAEACGDMAGTTAVLALVHDQQLIVANVGDSRGVLCDNKNTAIPITFDHKPEQFQEHKRIKEAGGFITFNGVWRVAGILATSRALGDYPLKDQKFITAEPDVLTFNLKDINAKFMILATDGLWDTFTNEEAVSLIINNFDDPYFGAKQLVMQAYMRGSTDNITVMVVNLQDLTLQNAEEIPDE
ncbi:protein phosphatase 1L-like [Limulus polyphemus]|uniref:Protein phosphatase 1L-like n=1 Tax=Limulus polyphemus TaxID=6850 RepID=A0ABM1B7U8_LIMPO|nr:protein phosphatase 1L-like [Limulus polyphemus]